MTSSISNSCLRIPKYCTTHTVDMYAMAVKDIAYAFFSHSVQGERTGKSRCFCAIRGSITLLTPIINIVCYIFYQTVQEYRHSKKEYLHSKMERDIEDAAQSHDLERINRVIKADPQRQHVVRLMAIVMESAIKEQPENLQKVMDYSKFFHPRVIIRLTNQTKQPLIAVAVEMGHFNTVELFLKYGVNPNYVVDLLIQQGKFKWIEDLDKSGNLLFDGVKAFEVLQAVFDHHPQNLLPFIKNTRYLNAFRVQHKRCLIHYHKRCLIHYIVEKSKQEEKETTISLICDLLYMNLDIVDMTLHLVFEKFGKDAVYELIDTYHTRFSREFVDEHIIKYSFF